MFESNYPQVPCGTIANCDVERAGPLDILEDKKAQLESQLAKVNAALDALKANPEISNLLQLVGKALR